MQRIVRDKRLADTITIVSELLAKINLLVDREDIIISTFLVQDSLG